MKVVYQVAATVIVSFVLGLLLFDHDEIFRYARGETQSQRDFKMSALAKEWNDTQAHQVSDDLTKAHDICSQKMQCDGNEDGLHPQSPDCKWHYLPEWQVCKMIDAKRKALQDKRQEEYDKQLDEQIRADHEFVNRVGGVQ